MLLGALTATFCPVSFFDDQRKDNYYLLWSDKMIHVEDPFWDARATDETEPLVITPGMVFTPEEFEDTFFMKPEDAVEPLYYYDETPLDLHLV